MYCSGKRWLTSHRNWPPRVKDSYQWTNQRKVLITIDQWVLSDMSQSQRRIWTFNALSRDAKHKFLRLESCLDPSTYYPRFDSASWLMTLNHANTVQYWMLLQWIVFRFHRAAEQTGWGFPQIRDWWGNITQIIAERINSLVVITGPRLPALRRLWVQQRRPALQERAPRQDCLHRHEVMYKYHLGQGAPF